mmetsp:Transcript_66939/g.160303  ORF Transcript_66939/g.160303 Transcript_66939/m.160303 type:complete len:341 (-) Transcript_66939:28-1050(-)
MSACGLDIRTPSDHGLDTFYAFPGGPGTCAQQDFMMHTKLNAMRQELQTREAHVQQLQLQNTLLLQQQLSQKGGKPNPGRQVRAMKKAKAAKSRSSSWELLDSQPGSGTARGSNEGLPLTRLPEVPAAVTLSDDYLNTEPSPWSAKWSAGCGSVHTNANARGSSLVPPLFASSSWQPESAPTVPPLPPVLGQDSGPSLPSWFPSSLGRRPPPPYSAKFGNTITGTMVKPEETKPDLLKPEPPMRPVGDSRDWLSPVGSAEVSPPPPPPRNFLSTPSQSSSSIGAQDSPLPWNQWRPQQRKSLSARNNSRPSLASVHSSYSTLPAGSACPPSPCDDLPIDL